MFQSLDFWSFCILGLSVLFIAGSSMEIVSKTFRQQLQERVIEELPENKKFLESKEGLRATHRARIATLIFGTGLLLVWLFFLRFWI